LFDPKTQKWYAIHGQAERDAFGAGTLAPIGTGGGGSTGIQGVTGIGAQGLTGIPGSVGPQGVTGLLGVQGDTGLAGLQGATGLLGDTGYQGNTGVQGSTGVGLVSTFVSAEQTASGASQNVAHGLGSTPTKVLVSVTDNTASSNFIIVEGSHTATDVVVTVTAGVKFKVLAML